MDLKNIVNADLSLPKLLPKDICNFWHPNIILGFSQFVINNGCNYDL